MSIWSIYRTRMGAYGATVREAARNREWHRLNTQLPDNLSYHDVLVEGEPCRAAVVNSDIASQKTIFTDASCDMRGGEYVDWMDTKWLVTECDSNTEVYTKATMIRCNHLLHWIDPDDDKHIIHEQWCIIEDGTKLKYRAVCVLTALYDSLAYRKRCVKKTPLIAGNP